MIILAIATLIHESTTESPSNSPESTVCNVMRQGTDAPDCLISATCYFYSPFDGNQSSAGNNWSFNQTIAMVVSALVPDVNSPT
ncbi:hypothetical protein FF1_041206 [Malus domestica]